MLRILLVLVYFNPLFTRPSALLYGTWCKERLVIYIGLLNNKVSKIAKAKIFICTIAQVGLMYPFTFTNLNSIYKSELHQTNKVLPLFTEGYRVQIMLNVLQC